MSPGDVMCSMPSIADNTIAHLKVAKRINFKSSQEKKIVTMCGDGY